VKKSIESEALATAKKATDPKYLAKITPVIVAELEKGDKNRHQLQAVVVKTLRLKDGFKALCGVKEVIRILQMDGLVEMKWKDTAKNYDKMRRYRMAILNGEQITCPVKNFGFFGLVKKNRR
jgi:hypothetical protein